MAHGKSTVVKAISGVQTVRFKNELERNITIKLGYANAKIYRARDTRVPRYGGPAGCIPCLPGGCSARLHTWCLSALLRAVVQALGVQGVWEQPGGQPGVRLSRV